jgi:Flp pilus assembly protein TadG
MGERHGNSRGRLRARLACSEGRVARAPRRICGVEGAALVEFAFTAGILFALLIGAIEMYMGLYAYHATAEIARQTTRWAMVRGSDSCSNTPNLAECGATAAQIQSYASSLGFLNIPTSDVTVNWCQASATQPTTWSTCSSSTSNAPGNVVQVAITYPFSMGIPFGGASTINVTSTSQVVISQ